MTARTVLFATQTAHPWGGVETWLDDLVPALEGRGWRVVVGLARGPRFHRPAAYRVAHPAFASTIEIDRGSGSPEGRVRGILRAIRDVRPDIVVPVNIADTLEAVRRAKTAGSPLRMLYPLHGLGGRYFLDAREFAPTIDAAVSSSRLGAAALVELCGLPADRVRSARCGAKPPVAPKRDPVRGVLRLGFVGRLTEPEKRVRQIPAIVRVLVSAAVPFELDIAGTGEDEEALRRVLADGVGGGSIRFHGYLPPDELYRRIYPALDVLLVLSDRETGPLAVWEAMRHGVVPVVSRYRGLTSEGVLRHGENALVSPVGAPDAIGESLKGLARNPLLLSRLGACARATADAELDAADRIAEWAAAFESCLDAPPRNGRHAPVPRMPAGRLDRWLGAGAAESLRSTLGRRRVEADAGAEWPHVRSAAGPAEDAAEIALAEIDDRAGRRREATA